MRPKYVYVYYVKDGSMPHAVFSDLGDAMEVVEGYADADPGERPVWTHTMDESATNEAWELRVADDDGEEYVYVIERFEVEYP